MTASAPSSTAFATSEVSARVGTGLEIIDSSICVATMTGFATRRASSTARFCTIGTASSGSSTPRSPRATMMASNASMISSRLSTACGFSILAMTGTLRPSSAMISWTRSMSAAFAHERQGDEVGAELQAPAEVGLVLLGQRGHVDGDAGQVDALVVRDRAGDDDLGGDDRCRRPRPRAPRTLPSSISRKSPGLTSWGRPLNVVEEISLVPRMSSVVILKMSPSASS